MIILERPRMFYYYYYIYILMDNIYVQPNKHRAYITFHTYNCNHNRNRNRNHYIKKQKFYNATL